MAWTERPFARVWIPSLVREGLGITKIVNTLKDMGFGYRTQTMFQDVHAFKGFMDKEYLFSGFDRSIVPSGDMFVETELRRAKSFRVFGEAKVYNMQTGEYETRMISMYTNHIGSFDEMEAEFLRLKEEEKYEPSEIVEGIAFKGIQHNEDFPY